MNGGGGASILGGGGTTISGGGGGFLISSITFVSIGARTTSTTFLASPDTSAYTMNTWNKIAADIPTKCRRGSRCRLEKSIPWDLQFGSAETRTKPRRITKAPASLWPAGTRETDSVCFVE